MGILNDQVVIVTGAGQGLGAAYASAVAAAGATVVINDLVSDSAARVADSLRADGLKAVVCPGDVSDWSFAEELISSTTRDFGRLDALVNNAGYFALAKPIEQEYADARKLVEVNLMGTIACGVAALKVMARQGFGSVVNVTSGEQMGKTSTAIYGATKGAIASLTYSWSVDMEKFGVRVNAISPNAHTHMADVYMDYLGQTAGSQNAGVPAERNAPVVVFLISSLANGINGQVVRLSDRDLMLCTHPANLAPVLHCEEGWTVDLIAAAFDETLKARLQPAGVQTVDIEVHP